MADTILELTARGRALEAKIQKGDGEIPFHITRIVTGAGSSQNPTALNNVEDIRQTFSILSREVEGFRAILHTYLDNQDVMQGYSIMQHGVYAMDPDEGEILYMISQFNHPNWMPPISERLVEFTPSFNFEVGNVAKVTFEVNPSGWQEHVSQTVHDGVHDMKVIDGRLSIFDGRDWKAFSPEDVTNAHNVCPTAHENRFSQTMPLAPLGAVHGAIGGRWEALEGTELRAVVMVSEDVKFSFTNRYIDIPQDQFDRFEVFYITVNGAMARIEKNPMKQTLFAVGADFEHYAFVYDGENMRVEVRRLGIAASMPNILHNWDLRNPVNQRGLLVYPRGIGNRYTIDRWRISTGGGVTLENRAITLEYSEGLSAFVQIIEPSIADSLNGLPVTLSVEVDGVIYSGSTTVNRLVNTNLIDVNIGDTGFRVNLRNWPNDGMWFRINASAPGVLRGLTRVKLEVGTVSTLTNDPPMDFGRELAVCQRYQRILDNPFNDTFKNLRDVHVVDNVIFFEIEQTMRIHPQIVMLTENSCLRIFGRTVSSGIHNDFVYSCRLHGSTVQIRATKTNHGLRDAQLVARRGVLLDANL